MIFEESVCRDDKVAVVVACFCFRIPGLVFIAAVAAAADDEDENEEEGVCVVGLPWFSFVMMSSSRGISKVGVGFRKDENGLLVLLLLLPLLLLSGWKIEDLSLSFAGGLRCSGGGLLFAAMFFSEEVMLQV